jgi:hypothetical protein
VIIRSSSLAVFGTVNLSSSGVVGKGVPNRGRDLPRAGPPRSHQLIDGSRRGLARRSRRCPGATPEDPKMRLIRTGVIDPISKSRDQIPQGHTHVPDTYLLRNCRWTPRRQAARSKQSRFALAHRHIVVMPRRQPSATTTSRASLLLRHTRRRSGNSNGSSPSPEEPRRRSRDGMDVGD